jgi:patatin-like phospholipase/acyl hydrolase
MTLFRILSLDGGGIRGLLTAIILERLETAVPGWLDRADLLAGTSTGGIIALGLAHGLAPADLRRLYEKKGRNIFDDTWWDDIVDIGKLAGADYDNRNLARELKNIFGNTRLRDLKKKVLIPAFDLDNENSHASKRSWAPKFFHNFPGKDSDGDQRAMKVALYTSAAPTYFPSVDGYIDGGVVANNPAMAALAQSQDERSMRNPPGLHEIALLSIGTGQSLVRIEGKDLDWGYAQWAKPLIDIMMDGVGGVSDYQCRQILGDRYCRISPVFKPNKTIPLDAVNKIPELVDFAGKVDLSEAVRWLRHSWK